MAKTIGSKCKICRAYGMKLFLKGERCNAEKCAFNKRPYPPGEHGKKRRKASNFALQMYEKQKVKNMYGILERQFRRYFHLAARSNEITGRALIESLERRLDNVVYRLCWATSRSEARQMVRHGFILVNERKVDIPSYQIKQQDTIFLRQDKGEDIPDAVRAKYEQITQHRSVPAWLDSDIQQLRAEVKRFPQKEDLHLPISEQMIVELYSK